MKTIVLLTDFSKRSEHAGRYAIRLARQIKANLVLFKAFSLTAKITVGQHSEWLTESYEDMQAESEKKLKNLKLKFLNDLKKDINKSNFIPQISYQCEEGSVVNMLDGIEEDKDIILMVLATHGPDNTTAFMLGNHCQQIIGAANIPLLIIPDNVALQRTTKFVFATDLVHNNEPYIRSLTSLAKHFSAEVIVVNVQRNTDETNKTGKAFNTVTHEIIKAVNYKNLSFRTIPSDNVKQGLDWVIENIHFDVLSMVHRKSDPFDIFSRASITKQVADHAYVPLLIYPYPTEKVSCF
jgi:nucleotide-binding universal stress UspA family protein